MGLQTGVLDKIGSILVHGCFCLSLLFLRFRYLARWEHVRMGQSQEITGPWNLIGDRSPFLDGRVFTVDSKEPQYH
jgi:hypothetical protein